MLVRRPESNRNRMNAVAPDPLTIVTSSIFEMLRIRVLTLTRVAARRATRDRLGAGFGVRTGCEMDPTSVMFRASGRAQWAQSAASAGEGGGGAGASVSVCSLGRTTEGNHAKSIDRSRSGPPLWLAAGI